ncbi:hypothetical protein [Burkholderia cepacia]|uniref:hypothetical protein n=1 Tax=Burkholderia cepacia TaxID=292 RepID=UPI000A50B252|nr:hypothetical protein [Burkholderia cepacia]
MFISGIDGKTISHLEIVEGMTRARGRLFRRTTRSISSPSIRGHYLYECPSRYLEETRCTFAFHRKITGFIDFGWIWRELGGPDRFLLCIDRLLENDVSNLVHSSEVSWRDEFTLGEGNACGFSGRNAARDQEDCEEEPAYASAMQRATESQTAGKQRSAYPEIIEGYRKWWGGKKPHWFSPPTAVYTNSGIDVSVNPEIGLLYNDTSHAIKLYLKDDDINKSKMDLITALMEHCLRQKASVNTRMGSWMSADPSYTPLAQTLRYRRPSSMPNWRMSLHFGRTFETYSVEL